MIERAGGRAVLSKSAADLTAESTVVMPGVGAFDAGMAALKERGFDEALRQIADEGEGRILGLCLGMQLLFDGSAEGSSPGLGLIPGSCQRIPSNLGVRVPHMGWNVVKMENSGRITGLLPEDSRFYFAHSFIAEPRQQSWVTLSALHGLRFSAAIEKENIFGAQFHPEKSHRFGANFMRGFIKL
jgi:glutamine amidotransferase